MDTKLTKIGKGRVRYSKIRANNAEWILLEQLDGFVHLYTIDGVFVRVLPRTIRTDTQAVFSRIEPDCVYTVEGTQVWKHNLVNYLASVVGSFPQYMLLSSKHAEGDLSEAGFIALCGERSIGVCDIFLFNVLTGQSSDFLTVNTNIDGISAAGDRLIMSNSSGLYDVFKQRKLTNANGHACTVPGGILWCSSADPILNANAVYFIPIDSPDDKYELVRFDWRYAMHLTAAQDTGIVSLYDPTGVLPNQIRLIRAGTSELLHEWAAPYRNYASSPKATYSTGRILFNVDDGKEIYVWMLEVPFFDKVPPMPSADTDTYTETRIDYASFVGEEFIMRPRVDGAVDIFHRKREA